MTLHLLPTLADSLPDISKLPAEFVQNFIIMFVFMMALGGGGWFFLARSRKATGQRDEPVHVAQPLEVKKHAEYAPKEETRRAIRELDEKIEKLREDWLTQTREAQAKASDEIQNLMQAGHEREIKIIEAVGNVKVQLMQTVTEACNELRRKADGDVRDMNRNIQDAIRLAGGKK